MRRCSCLSLCGNPMTGAAERLEAQALCWFPRFQASMGARMPPAQWLVKEN